MITDDNDVDDKDDIDDDDDNDYADEVIVPWNTGKKEFPAEQFLAVEKKLKTSKSLEKEPFLLVVVIKSLIVHLEHETRRRLWWNLV